VVRSVIRSAHKLAYEDAQAVIEGTGSVSEETDQAVRDLAALARKLRAKRAARGSIDFDLPEARVVLNTEGEPTDIQKVLRLEAHRLVEDFMILANETVDRAARERKLPFLRRVHEHPDGDRLERLRRSWRAWGPDPRRPVAEGPPEGHHAVRGAAGREPGVHGGAAVHEAGPVQREAAGPLRPGHGPLHPLHLPHPALFGPGGAPAAGRAMVDGEKLPEELRTEHLPAVARRTSERERVAVDAERDSVDLKKTEFMEQHVGDVFEGTISGVTSFGLFVLLDRYFVEGLVHVSSLGDDYYVFLEDKFTLVGEHTKKQFRLGDRLRVRVASVNLEDRKIDFVLARPKAEAVRPRAPGFDRDGGAVPSTSLSQTFHALTAMHFKPVVAYRSAASEPPLRTWSASSRTATGCRWSSSTAVRPCSSS
jgi:ribonuclease R